MPVIGPVFSHLPARLSALPTIFAMNLPLPRMKLPIGIQTFAKLREQVCGSADR